MASETVVTVAPNSTGENIRVLQVRAMKDDGTINSVDMQVVSIADKNGRLINLDSGAALGEILDVLREIKFVLELK